MAYRQTSRRRSTRSPRSGYRSRSSAPRRSVRSRAAPRRRSAPRRGGSSGARTIRIEVVQSPANPVSRPDFGMMPAGATRKAQF